MLYVPWVAWCGSDKVDDGPRQVAGQLYRRSSDVEDPVETAHGTIIQVHDIGPFEVNYVNPADDPRKKTSAKQVVSKPPHQPIVEETAVGGYGEVYLKSTRLNESRR